jgi:ubiquinone/menaquinone biosynthesis C-methylase UbiE
MKHRKLCEIVSRKLEGIDALLDIGCGDGFLVRCLARRLNKRIIGLDISAEGFAKAYGQCKKFGVCHLIECVKGDAHDMKMFKNNEFDASILVYSLHHMDSPEIVLREARRVLKPGGKIVIVDYVIRKRRSKCHQFVSREIKETMRSAGFRDVSIQKLDQDLVLVTSRK